MAYVNATELCSSQSVGACSRYGWMDGYMNGYGSRHLDLSKQNADDEEGMRLAESPSPAMKRAASVHS